MRYERDIPRMAVCCYCRELSQTDGMQDFLRKYTHRFEQSAVPSLGQDVGVLENARGSVDNTETASQQSSTLGAWADDPEVQEKVR